MKTKMLLTVVITFLCGLLLKVNGQCVSSKPTVMVSGSTLTAPTISGATYRWLDCGNMNAEVGGVTSTTYTATATGSYAVEVTRANGCKDTSTCITATVTPCTKTPPAVTVNRAALSTTPVTGETYRWLDCNNMNAEVAGGVTTATYIATVMGSYAVEVTRANGCKDTSTCMTATVTPCTKTPPVLTVNGSTLSTTPVTGETYRWLDCNNMNAEVAGGVTTATYTVTVIGSYAVEVTRANGCKDTSTCMRATVPCTKSKPNGYVSGPTLYVYSKKIGETYRWLDCDNMNAEVATGVGADSLTYIATVQGRYAVEVTRPNGCKDTSTCFTTVPCPPIDPPTVTVNGINLSANAVEKARSYRWLDCNNMNSAVLGATGKTYIATVMGSYAVEVTRASNNCRDTSMCVVTVPCTKTSPTVTVNGAVLSTSAVAGETYRWLDCNNMNSEVKTLDRVLKFDYNKAPEDMTFISEFSAFNDSYQMQTRTFIVYRNPSDKGEANRLESITVADGTSERVYLIGNLYRFPGTQNIIRLRNNALLGWVVTITNTGGVITYTLGEAKNLSTNTGSPPDLYDNSYNDLSSNIYSINMSDEKENIAYIVTETSVATYTATAIGRYVVEVTRVNNCKDTSACMTATVPCTKTPPAVTVNGATLSTSAVAGETYRWLDCNNMNMEVAGGITTATYTATATGSYSVEVTRANRCKDTSACMTATVCTKVSPAVTVNGATLSTTPVAGETYRWLDCNNMNMEVAGGLTTATYTATVTGSYSVEVTRANGCKDTSACMTATLPCTKTPPVVTVNGATLSTSAVAGETYRWLDCNNMSMEVAGGITTSTYTATVTGSYSVEVTRANGCKDTSMCMATVPCTKTPPAVTTRTGGVLAITTPVTGATHRWLDCTNNYAELATTETYRVTANSGSYALELTRPNGCVDTSMCERVCNSYHPVVTTNGATLSTTSLLGSMYEWLDCNNSSIKVGANAATFTATTSGQYQVLITDALGCQFTSSCFSACITDKPTVSASGAVLSTPAEAFATYRWLDCDNMNAEVSGATSATYTATVTGMYAVEITRIIGCKDTSDCVTATGGTPCVKTPPMVTVNGAMLSTNDITGATYRWLDCGSNKAVIMNATNATFTATVSGSYAVEVTKNNCKDTSVCIAVCVDYEPTVAKAGAILTTPSVEGTTYQWLDCGNNNRVVANATTNTYTATVNGSYAVELIKGTCKDTSMCIAVTGVGLIENTFASDVKLYPNPTSDNITVELGNNYSNVTVEITNVLGQVITRKNIATITNHKIVLPIVASSGIYFVRVATKEGFASFRVVKE